MVCCPVPATRPLLNRPKWQPMATSPSPRPCNWPSHSNSTPASWGSSCARPCWPRPLTSCGCKTLRLPALASSTFASSPPPSSRWCAKCWRPKNVLAFNPATASACWWSLSRPTQRVPCMWATADRLPWVTPFATCLRPKASTRLPRVLLQRRGCADQHLGHQHAVACAGLQAG